MQKVDKAIIPAVAKVKLRDGQTRVQRRLLDAAKAAVAANKAKAIQAATQAAQDAVSSAKTFLVLQLHVGVDDKAAKEALKAVQKAHPELPALFISSDSEGLIILSSN